MTVKRHNHRVVIIGWDGATFDLLLPWVQQGKLPNFSAFLAGSVHGPLRSTTPPFTYPAWTSFVTGKNPGRHGVFDFTQRVPGTHRLQFVNARSMRAKTIWRLLSDAGCRVACMGLPVSFPPEPVNGVVICGFDAPGSGSRTDSSSVYPPELLGDIRRNVGSYVTSANIMPLTSNDQHEQALDLILETLTTKARTARYLLDREPWDVLMVLFGESDLVGHHFWRFTDPKSPLYTPPSSSRVSEALYQVYSKLDELLGMLLEACPPDCVRLMVSDHGFGGSGDHVIYMNRWLAEEGFLTFAGDQAARSGTGYRLINRAKNWGLRFLPPAIKTHIFRRRPEIAGRMEAFLRFGGIDWSRTQAFSEELPYLQNIWINVKGQEPYGIVEPGRQYDEVVARLRERLLNWVDPLSGEKVVAAVHHREEVYVGPYVEQAPDLLVVTHTPGGYAYQGKSSRQAEDSGSIVRLRMDAAGSLKFYAAKSGSHRDYGIFLAQGPMMAAGQTIQGARLMDIAPTILYLLQQPVPADMDGVVLTSALQPEYTASRAVQRGPAEGERAAVGAANYTPDEDVVMAKRLQDLGYLE
jgi:predicted AlkP superfamily phosphohydrolase/phosphomutase